MSSRTLDAVASLAYDTAVDRSQIAGIVLTLLVLAAIAVALVVPKKRKPTKPSRAAKQARLEAKKRQSDKKRERRWRGD